MGGWGDTYKQILKTHVFIFTRTLKTGLKDYRIYAICIYKIYDTERHFAIIDLKDKTSAPIGVGKRNLPPF